MLFNFSYISTQTHLFGINYFVKSEMKEKEQKDPEKRKQSEELIKINKKTRRT